MATWCKGSLERTCCWEELGGRRKQDDREMQNRWMASNSSVLKELNKLWEQWRARSAMQQFTGCREFRNLTRDWTTTISKEVSQYVWVNWWFSGWMGEKQMKGYIDGCAWKVYGWMGEWMNRLVEKNEWWMGHRLIKPDEGERIHVDRQNNY